MPVLCLWVPDSGNDAVKDKGTDTGKGNDDDNGGADSLIATFDAATDDLAAIRANASKYALTGIFANPSLANWNNFDGRAGLGSCRRARQFPPGR